ncbi:hypothetical protein XA68_17765 [Ophiocordyceps unilateralis]|uniref:Uncharacterized protein n=1 Tax=Ophiocordyceps unilateralis TaxID=268505 RepID=A0A2A9PQK7_OPHUN|nr:hypothetical protein XA68_17765 [Ophiocordyceps unilateralis]
MLMLLDRLCFRQGGQSLALRLQSLDVFFPIASRLLLSFLPFCRWALDGPCVEIKAIVERREKPADFRSSMIATDASSKRAVVALAARAFARPDAGCYPGAGLAVGPLLYPHTGLSHSPVVRRIGSLGSGPFRRCHCSAHRQLADDGAWPSSASTDAPDTGPNHGARCLLPRSVHR